MHDIKPYKNSIYLNHIIAVILDDFIFEKSKLQFKFLNFWLTFISPPQKGFCGICLNNQLHYFIITPCELEVYKSHC